MSGTGQLRAAIAGLLGFAAAQEQALLADVATAGTAGGEHGTPQRWAPGPVVAHNTDFKHQQLQRLEAIRSATTPPSFAEIDHGSAQVYRSYAADPAQVIAGRSWQVTGALIEGITPLADADLLDPSRHPWLGGRQLWLQVIVRGFWHPCGHLSEYYLAHDQADRAIGLLTQAVATADYLAAPEPARGMAQYNLACGHARAGQWPGAATALAAAVRLNPELRAKAAADPDLAPLRSRAAAGPSAAAVQRR